MNTNIGERLKIIRKDESQKDFGSRFGVNLNTIGRYEAGTTSPSGDFIVTVCQEYNINPSWLLFGEEPMYKSTSFPGNIGELKQIPSSEKLERCEEEGDIVIPQWEGPDPEMFDYVPMAETQLSAGGGAFVLSEEIEGYYAFRKTWLHRVASSVKNLVLMRVVGNSMAPTVLEEDTVMIDLGRKSIREGMIFAIRMEDTVMIKRLSFRPGGKVLVISDNKLEFAPYEVSLAELHIIGQIIFFCRTFPTK